MVLQSMRLKYEQAKSDYKYALEHARANLVKIKQGAEFGYPDPFDFGSSGYFPLKLLRILDEKGCLIEVIEPGRPGAKPETTDTYSLVVKEPKKKVSSLWKGWKGFKNVISL